MSETSASTSTTAPTSTPQPAEATHRTEAAHRAGAAPKKAAPKNAAPKKTAPKKAAPKKAAPKKTAPKKAASTRKAGATARRTPAGRGRGSTDPVERDLEELIADVRTALDELAVQAELAGMEGRDRLRQQAADVEERWNAVRRELQLARIEAGDSVDTLRATVTKAAEAGRHVVNAALKGLVR